ncbi:MAG TPA: glycosyltransferase family 39 protein, partial [Solirubrobacteraceae bacterium]|nr:glycosyltransferase family 39 protein [Solirubrobacteraceae bacterium]
GSQHTLIFDESYYVNAARAIDRIEPPPGPFYHGVPLGEDPNAEHPQLAKLIIAGGIELFGDEPRGWRLPSVLFGLIALLALYTLVRAAGGGPWLAVGASGVMALDNLALVHGRIATLDIYALALMLIAATLYLRERPLLAGIALGVGFCMKEVALYLLFVMVLLELQRLARARLARGERGDSPGGAARAYARARGVVFSWDEDLAAALRRFGIFVLATCVSLVGLLWLRDTLVPAYDTYSRTTYAGDPFGHIGHILDYATRLTTRPDATGISSTPWQWLLNEVPIGYARVAVNSVSGGKVVASRAIVDFQGAINPFIVFLAIPVTFAALGAAWKERGEVAALGACWCLGTFLPFALESALGERITYIYYMLVVLPGLYILLAWFFSRPWMPRAALIGWVAALIYGFLDLYPLRTLL